MKYEAIVFDLDGTLLNTLDDLTDSVNYVMRLYGYAEKTTEQIREYVGNGVARLIERCVPCGASNEFFSEILNDYRTYYNKNCNNKTAPYSGIMDTLHSLASAKIKMAIVSNKPDSAVKLLNSRFFCKYIETALGEASGIDIKPAPDLVWLALKEMECTKERAVYIGDSEVDILTAENAGMDCISVSWGFRDAGFLRECGAKTVVGSAVELLNNII